MSSLFSILSMLMPVIEWALGLMGVSQRRKEDFIAFIEARAASSKSNVELNEDYASQVKRLRDEKQPGRDS